MSACAIAPSAGEQSAFPLPNHTFSHAPCQWSCFQSLSLLLQVLAAAQRKSSPRRPVCYNMQTWLQEKATQSRK